jgi:hypothetical protein
MRRQLRRHQRRRERVRRRVRRRDIGVCHDVWDLALVLANLAQRENQEYGGLANGPRAPSEAY